MVDVLAPQPVVDDLVELRARRRRPIQVQERVDSKQSFTAPVRKQGLYQLSLYFVMF